MKGIEAPYDFSYGVFFTEKLTFCGDPESLEKSMDLQL